MELSMAAPLANLTPTVRLQARHEFMHLDRHGSSEILPRLGVPLHPEAAQTEPALSSVLKLIRSFVVKVNA